MFTSLLEGYIITSLEEEYVLLWIQANYLKIAFDNFFLSNIKDFLFLTQFAIACPLWTVACHCQLSLLPTYFSAVFYVDLVTQNSIYPKYSVLRPAISQIRNDISWTILTTSERSHPLQNEILAICCLTAHLRSGKNIRFSFFRRRLKYNHVLRTDQY